jgi:DNA-binding response OmpR family regulator
MKILIAEDEGRIASFLEKGFRANGMSTEVAGDGEDALRLACSGSFDLLVLDLGLPGLDGFEVLRELRRSGETMPVVVLTARDSVRDTVAGLEIGADDYISKPFRFDELLARVRARLRDERPAQPNVLRAGEASLDLGTRQVIVGDKVIDLSAREFALAEAFFRSPGAVLSRDRLLREVWASDKAPSSNVVDVYVGYLRRKLGEERITSIRGRGYRLEARGGSP